RADRAIAQGRKGLDRHGAWVRAARQARRRRRAAGARDGRTDREQRRTTVGLQTEIEELIAAGAQADRDAARDVFGRLRDALDRGEVRAAEPDATVPCGWRVNTWVKQGILLGFRFGDIVDMSVDGGRLPFYDKDTMP